jgi:IS1 family transposase
VHHTTILKLLVLAGENCERIMAEKIRNVVVRDLECDELWSYCGCKQRRVRPGDDPNRGDCYVFVAVERHTKLVLNIAMGKRDQRTTDAFVEGIRHATARTKFQITTDGFSPYTSAITTTLHDRISGYAKLIKVYRASQEGEARYSPAEVQSVEVVPVFGQPDPERICTSIVERSNLSTAWATGDSPGLQMPSLRSGRTTGRLSPAGSRFIIFAAFTNRCAVLQRWQRELRTTLESTHVRI